MVIFITFFPPWFVPIISVLVFPEVSLLGSVFYGAVFSLLVGGGFRVARIAKSLGWRLLVVVVIVTSLVGLLIGFLSKLL